MLNVLYCMFAPVLAEITGLEDVDELVIVVCDGENAEVVEGDGFGAVSARVVGDPVDTELAV